MNKEICSWEYTDIEIINNIFTTYSDKNITMEECFNDRKRREVIYGISGRMNEIVHEVEKGNNFGIYTIMYFNYIKDGIFPALHVSPDNTQNLSLRLDNGKVMQFRMEFNKQTYRMDLGRNIFILDKQLEDPYKLEESLCGVISIVGDKLFIMDFDQREFYCLNSNYERILFGKVYNKTNITEFYVEGEYKKLYNTHRGFDQYGNPAKDVDNLKCDIAYYTDPRSILAYNCSDSICRMSKIVEEDSVTLICPIPFVMTSEGPVLSVEGQKLYRYETREQHFDVKNLYVRYRALDKKTSDELDKEICF